MAGCPRPFAERPTLDVLGPPLPVSAVLDSGTLLAFIEFDQVLTTTPVLVPGNWTVIADVGGGPRMFVCSNAAASGLFVAAQFVDTSPDAGADRVTYSPPPFDVVNESMVPAGSFTDFPLTVI